MNLTQVRKGLRFQEGFYLQIQSLNVTLLRIKNQQIYKKSLQNMSHHTYITYSEIEGAKPDEEEMDRIIASLNKESTFRLLAMINNFLALFPPNTDAARYTEIQNFLAANLFDDALVEKLTTYIGNGSLIDRPIFFRQQILFLMKKVMFESSNDSASNPDVSREVRNTVGKLCLMISNYTVSGEQEQKAESNNPTTEEESDRVLSELLVQMLPIVELENPPEITSALTRTLDYLNLFDECYPKIFDGKSISTYFESLTNISFDRFLQMIFGLYGAMATKDLNELIGDSANFNIRKSTYFQNLEYSQKEIAAFYSLTSISLKQLNFQLENSPISTQLEPQYDFLAFRKYPVFHLSEDILTCVDISFLIEKVSIGLYHTVLNALRENNVNPETFFQHWGLVFEKYVNKIFREIYPESILSNRFHPNTFYESKKVIEAFDGIVEYPNSLIVMQYKGGLLNAKAKYSGDVHSLLKEMNEKFGTKSPKSAISQLSRNIERLFDSDTNKRLKIRHLVFINIVDVYPIMILNDLTMEFGLAQWKLRKWFEEEMKTRNISNSVSVKSLMVMSIEDLEKLSPYLEAGDFTLLEFAQFYSALEYLRYSWYSIREHWYEPMTSLKEVFYRFRKHKKIAFRQNQKMQDKSDKFMSELMSLFKTESII